MRVQIFEGAEGMVELAPAVTTSDKGNFSFAVPAGVQYRLRFGGGDSQYVFTQSLTGTADGDSDAIASGQANAGMTAVLTAPPVAGQSDLTRDAGLSARLDLDVNDNLSLADAVDGAAGYLPGYEGIAQRVSAGANFNSDLYERQRMKLILEGFGSVVTANITKVVFTIVIPETTNYPGYASNKTHTSITGVGTTDRDYSLKANENWDDVTITAASLEVQSGGGLFGGQMEAKRTWVNFYAKDFGGAAKVRATVWHQLPGQAEAVNRVIDLDIPRDTDNDDLADKWELQMADRWVAQYGGKGFTTAQALARYDLLGEPGKDDEPRDPDGSGPGRDRLVEQGTAQTGTGDAHSVLEEYRGYILDGGGLDGQGLNGHAGGHLRLDPARKELLLEVDRTAVLNNVPGGNLRTILDGAAKVYSNADRGAGIYMYYLFDEIAVAPPGATHAATLGASRDTLAARTAGTPVLTEDFIHLLFIDTGIPAADGDSAITYDLGPIANRGTIFSTSQAHAKYGPGNMFGVTNIAEAFMTVVAHEITHMLFERVSVGPWNALEHLTPVMYESDLMYSAPRKVNRELATVTFFDVVQQEISVRLNQGITP